MACAIGSDDNQGEHKSKGLASDHAYTLIGAYDVDGHKLVKVRNPWGQFEWNGAWGDKDPNWTESMKRQVNFKNANDGVFYMAIEDYKATFGSTTICKVHDDYNLETINQQKKDEGNLTKFTVENPGNLFVSVSQVTARVMNKSDGYTPGKVRILIARINEHDSLEYVSN